MDTLVKVLKEAETAELVVEQDPIGAILSQRAAAGKRWQDQARTLMTHLKVSLAYQVCAACTVHVSRKQYVCLLDRDMHVHMTSIADT